MTRLDNDQITFIFCLHNYSEPSIPLRLSLHDWLHFQRLRILAHPAVLSVISFDSIEIYLQTGESQPCSTGYRLYQVKCQETQLSALSKIQDCESKWFL